MPCPHKFREYLTLDKLNFEPQTLIVGTFNPAWPDANYSSWFYGRTDNNYFWDLLPSVFGKPKLRGGTIADWKNFCNTQLVALTDLVSCIEDADFNDKIHQKKLSEYTDSAISTFKTHTPTNVCNLLRARPSIKFVYLTTTINSGLWKQLWAPINSYCDTSGIHCKQLMTPSKGARFNMKKDSGIPMFDFI